MAPTIPQMCRIFLASILAVLNTTMLKKKPPLPNQPKKSAAPVMKENNRAMEVDTVIIRNMVEAMAMDIPLMEAMVMEEDINRMAKDTEVDMEVTDMEAMVVTAATSLEATAVTVVTNSEVMEAT